MTRKVKVFYLEDNGDWRRVMQDIISALGYQFDSASTSEEAIFKLYRSTYHVALLDKRLSDIDPEDDDGLTVAHVIAKLDEGTKIILYTAYGTIDDARNAFHNLKVRDFIGKDKPIQEVKQVLQDAADEAMLEFQRPHRYSNIDLDVKGDSINKFLSTFDMNSQMRLQDQYLQFFAKRLLGEFYPLLPNQRGAQIIKDGEISILQSSFWSKMCGAPITVWIGRFDEMKRILQDSKFERLSSEKDQILATLFDGNLFPDLGGLVFENKDSDFNQYKI
ncbi:MAG: response regulator [Chloroflexota bacterium]